MAMILSRPKCPAIPPLCFSLIKLSLMELLKMHNWLPLNNVSSWMMKSSHFVLSKVIGSLDAFQASAKSGSSGYNTLSSLNPTTSNCISINKICLLLKESATLLDLPLLCFKTKSVTLQKLHPFQMSPIQFSQTIQVLQCLMISVQNKLFWQQVMSPFL